MTLSCIFVMDLKGRVIISRNYRGDVPMTVAERFANYIAETEEEDLRPMTGILGTTTITKKIGGKKEKRKNSGKTRMKKRLIMRARSMRPEASRRYTALGGARVRRCLAATTRAMTEVRMVTALISPMDRHGRTPVAMVLSDPGQFGQGLYMPK